MMSKYILDCPSCKFSIQTFSNNKLQTVESGVESSPAVASKVLLKIFLNGPTMVTTTRMKSTPNAST